MTKRKTADEFIQGAIECHGCVYDYSSVVYTTTRDKVEIICDQHGSFFQRPNRHLQGDGCPLCGDIRTGSSKIVPYEDLIQRAHEAHCNKYQYGDERPKVGMLSIICSTHGEFKQRIGDHIHKKTGCPQCANENKGSYRAIDPVDALQRCRDVHGSHYNYPDFEFTGVNCKIKVECTRHGIFTPTYSNHTHLKSGCPKCYASKGEVAVREYLIACGIKFVEQWTHPECISPKGRLLRYDFHLPDFQGLIEFDGDQHLRPVNLKGMSNQAAQESFIRTCEYDSIKNKFAASKGAPLLRIPYSTLNCVSEILEFFLKELR